MEIIVKETLLPPVHRGSSFSQVSFRYLPFKHSTDIYHDVSFHFAFKTQGYPCIMRTNYETIVLAYRPKFIDP